MDVYVWIAEHWQSERCVKFAELYKIANFLVFVKDTSQNQAALIVFRRTRVKVLKRKKVEEPGHMVNSCIWLKKGSKKLEIIFFITKHLLPDFYLIAC